MGRESTHAWPGHHDVRVRCHRSGGIAQLAVSASGTAAYVAPDPWAPAPVLGWVSRSGTFTEILTLPAGVDEASLSPDGTLAAGSVGVRNKVFIVDLVRRVTTPLMLGKRRVESVTWHPDGKRLTLGGDYLSLFDPDTGSETRLTTTGRPKRFASWARNGRTVTYMTFGAFERHLRADVERGRCTCWCATPSARD